MSYTVCVLCPNGHRVNVEVGPNTPLSFIKQQACDKHEFNPASFGLRREDHKGSLDLSFPFRLSGLPNRAKLELFEQSQKDALLNVALQLDTGQRFLGKCLNSSTLKDAIHSIGKEITSVSYVMYLQRKIESTEFTTLKLSDLGIFKGSAMLRLHKVQFTSEACSSTKTDVTEDIQTNSNQTVSVTETCATGEKESETKIYLSEMDVEEKDDRKKEDERKDLIVDESIQSAPILFNPATSAEFSSAAEPEEDFFEINDRDLKIMLRDLHRISEREFRFKEPEKEKDIPDKVVFRIRFPNGMMLQNIFNAKVDTTDSLYEFVKSYLSKDTSENLTLYQAPPNHMIKPGVTLVEAGLTTTSLLHAGGSITLKCDLTVEADPGRALSQLSGVLGVTRRTTDKDVKTNTASIPQQSSNSSSQADNKSGKPVPKWFKLK